MMKVTRKTHGMLAQIRKEHALEKSGVSLQRQLKNGGWGKARVYDRFGCEKTAEDVIARLESLNPNDHWRVAE